MPHNSGAESRPNAWRIYEKMMKELLFVVIIVAVAVTLLAIRLLLGKKNVVHTHIEGNREMERRGIHCVIHQDMEARLKEGIKTKIKS